MLREKLIAIFFNAATGSSRTRVLLTPLGPLVFFSILTLLIVSSGWVDRLLGLPRFSGHPLTVVVSIPLLAGGSFLSAWSVLSFLRRKGTPVPFNPPPELVDDGPYAYSRNPMLTGLFAVLWGVGVLMGSISLVFLLNPLFIGLVVWEIKNVEEPELEKRLGSQYVQYLRRVPMFWPGWNR